MSSEPLSKVTVYCDTHSHHVAQLYTGLGLLEASDVVKIDWIYKKGLAVKLLSKPYLPVQIERGPRLLFDQSDSFKIDDELDWSGFDLLCKRSFNRAYLSNHPYRERVLPTGLYYYVVDRHDKSLQRALWARNDTWKLKAIVRQSRVLSTLLRAQASISVCNPAAFEGLPNIGGSPCIIFFGKLWQAHQAPQSARESLSAMNQMNQMRIDIVRQMRAQFGNSFVGGLFQDEYSREVAPDCVIDPNMTKKANYLATMKKASVCIATNGLRESIGAKFAEYVAAGKAIVSQVNPNHIPGPFVENENYLTFKTVDECTQAVHRLLTDTKLRYEMMRANVAYYHSHLRPDMLMLNALMAASSVYSGQLADNGLIP